MEMGQRIAIEDQTSGLFTTIDDTVSRLNGIWDKVLLDEKQRENRVYHAYQHIHNMLKNLTLAEEEMALGVEKDIAVRRRTVQEMRSTFKMPSFDESPYPSGSIDLLQALDRDLATLSEQRDNAMKIQTQLHRRIKSLCARLDVQMKDFDDIADKVYDERKLDKMRSLIPELCVTLKRRVEKIINLQEESRKIYEALTPNASITHEEMALLQTDFGGEQSIVSMESVHQSETLNQKLKDEYDSWLEKVSSRYDELLSKMEDLSKKCHFPSMKQRVVFEQGGVKNERDLQRLEEDLQRMEERYERGRPVFDKLQHWMTLWKEKLDSEKRVCRVWFYKNRGGSVNNQLKRQKQVELELPRTFNELKALVEGYTSSYDEEDIKVEGVRPDFYVAGVVRAYQDEKEVQKVQKRFAKQQRYNPSVASPSRQATPYSQSNVPFRTPIFKTPMGTVKRKRSMSITDISEIQPVKGPVEGPRTSSPKTAPIQPPMSRTPGRTPKAKRG